MKKTIALLSATLLLLAGCAGAASPSAPAAAPSEAASQAPEAQPEQSGGQQTDALAALLEYVEENPYALNCINTGAFSTQEEDAPSDEELTRMMDFALSIGSAHSLTPAHFVVIRDYEEQASILNEGTVTEGTVTVLVLADTLRDQQHHASEYNDWYSQMYYGIFDAGASMSYLHLAANSLGYDTHFYAALNIPVDGEIDQTNGGRFDLIQGDNWEIEKYMASKDGSVGFAHTVGLYSFAEGEKTIPAEGNLTLLCVVVIGTLDEELDLETAATTGNKPANYNFWDPQGSFYGNTGAGDETGAEQDADVETGATDGGESATS